MNTLNFKALFRIGFSIFLRALGIYLLLTIPVLVVLPEIYLISAGYAISFGWLAALVFLPLFIGIIQIHHNKSFAKAMLYVIVLLAVLFAFQMMEVPGVQRNIWSEPVFLLFPACAVIAGWISLLVANKRIDYVLQPVQVYEEASIFSDMQ
ncbi:MAG: hypothetical protein QM726_24760 [Chitinophagaceae bacterium]